MGRKQQKPSRHTAAELSILQMLWEEGPLTLSEAHAAMTRQGQSIGYTTVQTRLERLVDKRAVAKSDERPARYQAAVEPQEVSAPLLDLLLKRVSGPAPLIAHLVQNPSLSSDDLAEIKRLVAEAEKRMRRDHSAE